MSQIKSITIEEITEEYELRITDEFLITKCVITTQSGYSVFGLSRFSVDKHFNKNVARKMAFAAAMRYFLTPINVKIIDNMGSPISGKESRGFNL